MRPFARILLNAATLLSLMMCVAVAGLWARSYRATDDVMSARAGGSLWALHSSDGRGELIRASPWFYDEPPRHFSKWYTHLMFGNAGCTHLIWWQFFCDTGQASWATRPENGQPYRASEELDGDFWFDDPRTGSVAVPHYVHLYFPLWSVACLALVLPVWRLGRSVHRQFRRRVRRSKGLCVNCGYDVRATPERCPECGSVPAAKR
jgi:hypothetical protein